MADPVEGGVKKEDGAAVAVDYLVGGVVPDCVGGYPLDGSGGGGEGGGEVG